MQFYKFLIKSKKYHKNVEELRKLLGKYNPAEIFIKNFFQGIKKPRREISIVIQHKSLGYIAKFSDGKILIDFKNTPKYLWLCVAHETAHILFRTYKWEKTTIYKILKSNYPKKMIYSIDQVCAILLQAHGESILKIRPLKWSRWQSTFAYMKVEKIGRTLWPYFLKYIKQKKRPDIFNWLLTLEKIRIINKKGGA
ncbi:MAG: hypothetical protein NTV77_00640 [Candidatus Azambacteria bacterium]|nr:hypothetical protein [Candidatus Azambacteria bacterium]